MNITHSQHTLTTTATAFLSICRLQSKNMSGKCGKPLLTAVLGIAAFSSHAEPLDDLSAGQTGRIEFISKTPAHRWALVRGRLGADVPIFGDLLMPADAQGKVPALVFSHGSEGVSSLYFDVWAKALNAAGYAVFVVNSFKPRNEERVTGATKQLTWNTTANTTDALMPSSCWQHTRKLIASAFITWAGHAAGNQFWTRHGQLTNNIFFHSQ